MAKKAQKKNTGVVLQKQLVKWTQKGMTVCGLLMEVTEKQGTKAGDTYNEYHVRTDNGMVKFSLGSVADSDLTGTIMVDVDDNQGNALETLSLTFTTSMSPEMLVIKDMLVFPNPYRPEDGNLMIGFSTTQGHIASAVPVLGHAVRKMKEGKMDRALFLAKGSLFLGRMTQLADGISFILEKNDGGK